MWGKGTVILARGLKRLEGKACQQLHDSGNKQSERYASNRPPPAGRGPGELFCSRRIVEWRCTWYQQPVADLVFT